MHRFGSQREECLDGSTALCAQDLLLATKRGLMPVHAAAAQLGTASRTFLEAHIRAYGKVHLRPKRHWMMDLADQLLRDNIVIDTFVVERQHLMVKAVAEPMRNTSQYEVSLLSSIVTVQVRMAKELKLGDDLIGRTQVLDEVPGAVVSDKLSVHGFTVAASEVILRGLDAARVVACAHQGHELFVFVAPLQKRVQVTTHAARYRRTIVLAIWRALDVQQCLAWKDDPDGVLVVSR